MGARDDENPFPQDEHGDAGPIIRELRLEMVRLQAQIDQLDASSRERTEEIADLRARLTQLESRLGAIRSRYRRNLRIWVWIAALYGATIGVGITYFMKP